MDPTISSLPCKLRERLPTFDPDRFRTDYFKSLIGSEPNAGRSEAKRQRPKPLPLGNLTYRRKSNLESLLQLDVPESASDIGKGFVVVVRKGAGHKRRIFIGHVLHPNCDGRAIEPGAPPTRVVLGGGDRQDVFLLAVRLHVLTTILGKARHLGRSGRRQVERIGCDQVERNPLSD